MTHGNTLRDGDHALSSTIAWIESSEMLPLVGDHRGQAVQHRGHVAAELQQALPDLLVQENSSHGWSPRSAGCTRRSTT